MLIQTLIPHLPRFAEEEGDFYTVPREALIAALSQHAESAIAENTVALVENLLDSLAVLNGDYLANGEWCFVSFPAQLMAVSVLTTWADQQSRWFAPKFWNTQGIDNAKKDQQRDVLNTIEQARFQHHASQQAQPIRYCYVAWSVIKLDGQILFYQREDTKKRNDPAAGDYGLIGGRANQNDLADVADKAAVLNCLQAPHSEAVQQALPTTLKRELREEAGLLSDAHYQFQLWRQLQPYQQVQGAAPNHALTEYYLSIFQINLTLAGYLFLRQRVKDDERLLWFSIADIENGATTDGKIAYIKALYDDFAGDKAALAAALSALPDSFSPAYLIDTDFAISLPSCAEQAVLTWKLGKDKPLNQTLSQRQLALVLGLAAHLRGFELMPDAGLILHPHGWIEIDPADSLALELQALAAYLRDSELRVESYLDRWFRLSINPATVFFADSLFRVLVNADDLASCTKSKIPLTIERQGFATALGWVVSKTEVFKLTLDFVSDLMKLADQAKPDADEQAVRIDDAYKKGLHKKTAFSELGLRRLIRREDGEIKVVLAFSKA